MSAVHACCADLSQKVKSGEIKEIASVDRLFGPILYNAIKLLPAEVLSETCFWQWLTLVELRPFTEMRMERKVTTIAEPAAVVRVLGGRSLEAMNRQVITRLFFARKSLAIGDDLSLAVSVLSKQQRLVDIFERRLGVSPRLARLSAEIFADFNDQQVKNGAVRLQALSQSLYLEIIPDSEIKAMF